MLIARANRAWCFSLLLAGLIGCVQVDQTLTLHPDGSGALSVRYAMARETAADLEARLKAELEPNGEPVPALFSFDEAQVREDFKELEPLGIELQDLRAGEENGSKYMWVSLRFRSLEALSKTEFLSDRVISLRRIGEQAFELRQTSAPSELAQPEMIEMMSGLLAGFRARVSVHTPGPILETNADERDDQRATWVFDLAQDPRALLKAQQMDLRVVFNGSGLSLTEVPAR